MCFNPFTFNTSPEATDLTLFYPLKSVVNEVREPSLSITVVLSYNFTNEPSDSFLDLIVFIILRDLGFVGIALIR